MDPTGQLKCIPLDVAERVLDHLTAADLANLRLVNREWKHLTDRHITVLRPRSLQPFLQGDLASRHPNLHSVDLTLIDTMDDAKVERIARELALLPSLENLTLRCGNDWSERSFQMLGRALPHLRRLRLQSHGSLCHGWMLHEAPPSLNIDSIAFEHFADLECLDLSWHCITAQVAASVASLKKLEILSLKNCIGVDDSIVEMLVTMPSLRMLNLTCANITDDALMTMNDLGLEVLNLSKCEGITDDGLFWLQHIRTLKKLDVSSCPEITSAGIEQLINLPNLTDLYMHDVKLVSSSFFQNMKQLSKLSLRDCPWVTNETLKDLVHCTRLESINLRNCNQVTHEGLKHLVQMPQLRSVNLRGCTHVDDAGIQILSELPLIEDLDLSFLSHITDAGLQSLARATSLRRLILNWCNSITADGLRALHSTCTQLEELSIKGCHRMQLTDLISMTTFCDGQKLDYEHSLCTVLAEEQKQELPTMRHIDSVGCFVEIC